MLTLAVEQWIGNAAAVLSGAWGSVTRRSEQSGYSRTAIYTHAERVVQAVASEQAGGLSYEELWAENERLRAANQELWQAWAEAEDLSEAKQREVAVSGSAMGLSLTQVVTLLAIVLPWGAVPSRATVGRWVQQAAAQAGAILEVLDRACQARVLALCLDEIFFHREPILMGIEPGSLAWVSGQRGPDRSGASWCKVIEKWPCLEHGIAEAGTGLERGVKLANEARATQVVASVSLVPITMGLDVFHTQRELERALRGVEKRAEHQLDAASEADAKVAQYRRRGCDARGVAGAAGRAWRRAAVLFEEAVQAHEAVEQINAALSWCDSRGYLYSRQTAQGQRDEALAMLKGACWQKAKRLLSDARALRHVDRLHEQLALAVAEPILREALTHLWYLSQAMWQAEGDEQVR